MQAVSTAEEAQHESHPPIQGTPERGAQQLRFGGCGGGWRAKSKKDAGGVRDSDHTSSTEL